MSHEMCAKVSQQTDWRRGLASGLLVLLPPPLIGTCCGSAKINLRFVCLPPEPCEREESSATLSTSLRA